MRRRILMVLLALGVVGGYGAGLASCAHHAHRCHAGWRANADGPCGGGRDGDARRNAGPPGPPGAPGHAQAGDARPRGPWHW